MPFRSNFFGDQYPQPGTDWAEIDTMLCDRGDYMAEPTNAEIITTPDEGYGIGGNIFVSAEDGEEVPVDRIVEFDGFETVEAARDWLISIGVPSNSIEEMA